ncbi:MAG: NAD(P)-dependent oxidoreductase [Methanoregulaceae archaeon]|jgi:UDP-glucose 4-epimerase
MRALVTGGSGFLGSYLVKELVKGNHEAVIYDLAIPDEFKNSADSSQVEYIQGDILNYPALCAAMKDCDIVFHTAAIADIDITRTMPQQTMQINVVGTANCLEAARHAGVKRFLFASSVYTAGKWGSFYRVSKQAGESLCKTYHNEFGLNYTILKYGSLYGRDANHWNFIYIACKALLTTGEFTYISSKDAVREYIHIFDAARETVRIAEDPTFSNKSVLITGHQRMKIEEFFSMLKEIIGKDVTIYYTPAEQHKHYIISPYSFEKDVPIRVNLSTYVDISEGILDCLREVQKELDQDAQHKKP